VQTELYDARHQALVTIGEARVRAERLARQKELAEAIVVILAAAHASNNLKALEAALTVASELCGRVPE
jgi:alkylhydroperoxidase/carboxymuconolactone decarboxylase family protein YurZ